MFSSFSLVADVPIAKSLQLAAGKNVPLHGLTSLRGNRDLFNPSLNRENAAVASRMRFYFLAALLLPLTIQGQETQRETHKKTVLIVSSLGDPAKLATLSSRGATADRLVKICFYLHEARASGITPESIVTASVDSWGWTGTAKGNLTAAVILHALSSLENYGCFDLAEDRASLKRGARPTIRRGRYAGEPVEMDHVVPVAIAPQWTQVIANLEPVPQSVNRNKSDSVDGRVSRHRKRLLDAGF